MQTYYKKEGLTHYFVVLSDVPVRSTYESRLFVSRSIPGFLPLEIREINGRQALYYRLDYRVSVREVSGHLKISHQKLRRMTGDIIAAIETAESYLLEPERILWRTDAIFMDTESGRLQFCYAPSEELKPHAVQEETNQLKSAVGVRDGRADEWQEKPKQPDDGVEEEDGYGSSSAGLSELLQEIAAELLQMADRRDGEGVQWVRRFYDLLTGDCTLEKLTVFQQGEKEEDHLMEVPVEPEEPYVVSGLSVQRAQEAQTGSRFEKPVKYGMAASAFWSASVLVGLLAGILPGAWVTGLMAGLVVLILLSLFSMQLYREDSPEEIMQDYFSREMPVRYMGQAGELKQDRFVQLPEGIHTYAGTGRGAEESAGRRASGSAGRRADGFVARGADEPVGQWGIMEASGYTASIRKPGSNGFTGQEADGRAGGSGSQRERWNADGSMEKDKDADTGAYRGQTVLLQSDAVPQEEVILWLRSLEMGKYQDVYLSQKAVVVGSLEDACDHVLKERGVSRMHAKLIRREGGLYLVDLNSTNGTYLNGERIESGKEYPLEEGDEVAFARCGFVVMGKDTKQYS